jgi:hypothetical protein
VIHSIEKIPTPLRKSLFEEAALDDPHWAVGMAAARLDPNHAVLQALQRSTVPPVQVLARIAESPYPEPIKGRMVVLMWQISNGRRTFEEAARVSSDDEEFFRTLVAMKLENHPDEQRFVDTVLEDEALDLTERLNELHDEPAAKRFRAVEPFTAQALYMLVAYGESVMYTSSYRGLFERLIAKMHQAKLTGAQLLASVHEVRFRAFIKVAAVFNRLDAFLATIPSPVDRWSLLARCMQGIDHSPDVAVQAVTAAGIMSTLQDPHSLRLVRDIIKNEYARAKQESDREALIVYGLLAANLAERLEQELQDQEIRTIGNYFASYIPDLTVLPVAKLFTNGVNLQRYFFYNDEDGEESFHSFLNQYRHTKSWHIEDKTSFVHIFSEKINERSIDIYANKPASEQYVSDIDQAIRQRGIKPHVIVHRGHSYHVEDTLDKLSETVAIVVLGNCGSYSELDAVLAKAPGAHIISTHGIGSRTVNDPLLRALNDRLLRGQDLRWADFWKQAEARLGHNPRFAEYIPPDQNTAAIFLKAYRSLAAPQQLAARSGIAVDEIVASPLQVERDSASAAPSVSWVRTCLAVPQ